MGDASNLVSIIAGELLQKAEHLLRMGLHPSDIVQGYEVASAKALEILEGMAQVFDLQLHGRLICIFFWVDPKPSLQFRQEAGIDPDFSSLLFFPLLELSVEQIKNVQTKEDLFKAVRSSIAAKQYGNEDMLTDLVCEAALAVMPKDASNFNVDNIRVVKIMGSSLYESRVIKGMVFGRSPEGMCRFRTFVELCTANLEQCVTRCTFTNDMSPLSTSQLIL